MAVKDLGVKINVDDTQFKDFSQLFAKYRTALKGVPGEWAKVSRESKTTKAFLEGIVAAMFAQTQILKKHEDSTKKNEETSKKTASHWRDVAKSTREVVGNIFKATESLVKWSLLTEAALGLAGAGGLFGLSRMAGNVAAGRRSSLGLRSTYGAEKAFGINFGQLVDSGSFLGAVNAARSDMTNTGFLGAGMSYSEQQGDTATVSVNLLKHLKKIADNTDPRMMSNTMHMLNLDQFASLEDMNRLRSMNPADFARYIGNFNRDKNQLNLDRDTQDKWMAFTQQMTRAGDRIENAFARTLVKLEPNLEKLSDSFVKLVESVGNSDTIKKWMDTFSEWLGSTADTIGTDEFAEKVNRFVDKVGEVVDGLTQLGHGIVWLAQKMGWISKEPEIVDVPKYSLGRVPKGHSFPVPYASNSNTSGTTGGWTSGGSASGAWGSPFSDAENSSGLPSGLLNSIYMAESGGGKYLRSKKGAIGPFQFMPRTAAQWVKGDPMNVYDASQGAASYMQYLEKTFRYELGSAVAAYNWGEGRQLRNVQKHGADWRSHLPEETRRYLGRVIGGIGGEAAIAESRAPGVSPMELRELLKTLSRNNDSKTIVEIFNNTGGSAVVSSSQLAVAQ